jgi:hypothetical protein
MMATTSPKEHKALGRRVSASKLLWVGGFCLIG